MQNQINMVEQIQDGPIFYTRFHGCGQDVLIGKSKDGQMTITIEPTDPITGIDIIGITAINHPKYRNNPFFCYRTRQPLTETQWNEARQNLQDAFAFTQEFVRRKDELFRLAGFDAATYLEENYNTAARKYVEEHPEVAI